MRPYLACIKSNLQLTLRDRVVLFFNYLMPVIFFAAFGEGFGARTSSGSLAQVISMVLMFGILGTGFFGGGMRATHERESGILRRFKVAPISPAPILVASIVTGWLVFLPSVFLFLALARFRYGMEVPHNLLSLLVIVSAGVFAFRALGLILAAVANSMAESQIIIQLLYLPMLMLSGATVPLSIMPDWLQTIAQFLPSTHLYLGMQAVLVRGESVADNLQSVAAMALTLALGLFIAVKLFRWEKEEKIKASSKLWVLAVLAPFIATGAWQAHSRDNLRKTRILTREMKRGQTWLIRGARIFTGNLDVIESGALLIRDGRILTVYPGTGPKPEDVHAETIEAAGRTVLPALIDSSVNLNLTGAATTPADPERHIRRALAAYLYSGIAAVRISPAALAASAPVAARIASGEIDGAEVLPTPASPSAPSLIADLPAAGFNPLAGDPLLQQVLEPAQSAALLSLARSLKPDPAKAALSTSALRARLASGEPLAPASRSGALLIPHGAALHRELQLWVRSGISPREALTAATFRAATLAGVHHRLGLIKPGYDATLIIVEGNPLDDISATTRLYMILNRGEAVSRSQLLEDLRKDFD